MSLPSFRNILARLVAATAAAAGTTVCLVAVFEPDLGIVAASPYSVAGVACATSSARVGCDTA